jgi:hypothetical protein
MQQILMKHETALLYVDMDEDMFGKFIIPLITVLKFEDDIFYLSDQLDEAIYSLIDDSPVVKDFELHIVD